MKINLLFFALFVISVLNAQNLELDKTFGDNGAVKKNFGEEPGFQVAYEIKNFVNNSYLVMGLLSGDNDDLTILSKFTNTGDLDTTFANQGTYYLYEIEGEVLIKSFTILPSNKIAIHTQDEEFAILIILNEDGSLYKQKKYKITEGENITTNIIANEKHIYMSGIIKNISPLDSISYDSSYIFRFDLEGELDTTFGENGIIKLGIEDNDLSIVNMKFQGDNVIFAYASQSPNGHTTSIFISRLKESGGIDNNFANNGKFKFGDIDGYYIGIFINDKKEIFLEAQSEPGLVKLDINGDLDNTYGIDGVSAYQKYEDISFYPTFGLIDKNDGGFMFLGGSSEYGDESQPMIIKIDNNGFPDSSFAYNSVFLTYFGGNSGFINGIYDPEGRLVIVGYQTYDGEYSNFLIVRYKPLINSTKFYSDNTREFTLFPNPAQDYLSISFDNNFTGNIEIYDILGKMLYQQNVDNITSKSIDINKLKPGSYFLRLTKDHITTTKKFIVNK